MARFLGVVQYLIYDSTGCSKVRGGLWDALLRESFGFRGYLCHQNQRRTQDPGRRVGPVVSMTLHKVCYAQLYN